MDNIQIKTGRLIITEFDESMISSVHLNSLDHDTRRFVPDEVFETEEEARDAVRFFMERYHGDSGPFVYPILLPNKVNIGYVQAIPLGENDWEIGYHIAKNHTGKGYATEAVKVFVPVIMEMIGISHIWGICRADNISSRKVLEKCNFVLRQKTVTDYSGERHEVCRYLYRISELG